MKDAMLARLVNEQATARDLELVAPKADSGTRGKLRTGVRAAVCPTCGRMAWRGAGGAMCAKCRHSAALDPGVHKLRKDLLHGQLEFRRLDKLCRQVPPAAVQSAAGMLCHSTALLGGVPVLWVVVGLKRTLRRHARPLWRKWPQHAQALGVHKPAGATHSRRSPRR